MGCFLTLQLQLVLSIKIILLAGLKRDLVYEHQLIQTQLSIKIILLAGLKLKIIVNSTLNC